jgi:penicillin-binding protein A
VTRQIRLLGAGLLCCFLVLFVQLNRLTVLEADDLNAHPLNTRAILRDFDQPRGSVVTADGVVIARTVPSEGRFEHQRVFGPQSAGDAAPDRAEADLYAHVTGFYSINLGSTGVERTYNDELAGRTLDLQFQSLSDLFVQRERVGNVTLTIRDDVQRAARDALAATGRQGAVVAVDPRTGAILAMWSDPSYDPNLLSTHDGEAAAQASTLLNETPGQPRLSRVYQERFFPGSTFKLVTASAGLTSGTVLPNQTTYPVETGWVPPTATNPIRNFGGSACGGDLFDVLAQSCNAAFARMAVDVEAPQMIGTAEAYGFNDSMPIDLPEPAASSYPTDFERDLPKLAMTGIGQNEVQATPLQMAMVAATVANEGDLMAPHVMSEVTDSDGDVVDRYEPRLWRRPIDTGSATILREAMQETAERGTATALQIEGMVVGGKTGTAQVPTDPPRSDAWIVGYAGPPDEPPQVAVGVYVRGGDGEQGLTGGSVAAPVGRAVMEVALQAAQ